MKGSLRIYKEKERKIICKEFLQIIFCRKCMQPNRKKNSVHEEDLQMANKYMK